MISIACLLLLFLSAVSQANGQQRFVVEPEGEVVQPGTNHTLTCTIANMGELSQCRWQKDYKPVGIFSGKYSIPEDSRQTGDCSLTIVNLDVSIDEGEWQCGVTSSNVTLQDSLVSSPVWLAVMVPPSEITIESQGELTGETLTVMENELSRVKCITRLSNPAPRLAWRLGGRDLVSGQQSQEAEEGVRGKVRTEAVLEHQFTESDLGSSLECVVSHPAYSDGSPQSVAVTLDVLYLGPVSISSVSSPVLEDGVGTLSLSCMAPASPVAQLMWISNDTGEVVTYGSVLQFSPVLKQNSGSYFCSAGNTAGNSSSELYHLNVLYGPSSVRVEPPVSRSVRLDTSTVLRCEADGSPCPTIQWLHTSPAGGVQLVGSQPSLQMVSVDYSQAGDYICRATNTIDGVQHTAESDIIQLSVEGGPRLVDVVGPVRGRVGSQLEVEVEVCSVPPPHLTTWQWGPGILLSPGGELDGRWRVEMVSHPHHHHHSCYLTTLTIARAQQEDSGEYVVRVENENGMDMITLQLDVTDSLSMLSIISVVITLLIIFLVIVIVITLLYTRNKLCFKGRGEKGKILEVSASPVTDKETSVPYKPSLYPAVATKELSGSDLSLQLNGHDQTSLSPYVMCSLNPSEQSLPGTFNRSRSGSNVSIYNQLQFPSTSNYGSMKRKKRTQLNSASSSSNIRQEEYFENNVKIWSLEYHTVPQPVTVKV